MSRSARLPLALRSLLRRRRFLAFTAVLIGLFAFSFFWVVPYFRVGSHLRAARSETQLCHNRQAIDHLQICLREWPNNPEVLMLAARATRRERNYAESGRLLGKYQQLRGLDDAASFEQLLLSVELNVEGTGDRCRRLVESGHPESSLILEALTRGHLQQYQLQNARACLNRWLNLNPDCVQAWYLCGLFIYDYCHAPNEAEKCYRRAVELDPAHEEARHGLAVILTDAKSYAEAIEHLEILRQSQPDNLALQMGLAECRAGLGESSEARRLLEGILAGQPGYEPAIALQGRLALEDGEYEQAESRLREALAITPSDHRARHNLVKCLNQLGKKEEAGRHQQELDQLEKDRGQFEEIVMKELPQRPRDPSLHCTLGRLLLRGGYTEEGLRWLNSALLLDPHYAPAQQALTEYRDGLAKEKKQEQRGP
jgi:tetratricopeptide (TPR) repeat protein